MKLSFAKTSPEFGGEGSTQVLNQDNVCLICTSCIESPCNKQRPQSYLPCLRLICPGCLLTVPRRPGRGSFELTTLVGMKGCFVRLMLLQLSFP